MRFEGKVALVTGGASGIGLATVEKLARRGCFVLINHLPDDPAGPREAARLLAEGFRVGTAPGDVSVPGEAEAMVTRAIDQLGRLDILVNNAGVGKGGPPEEQTLADWRWLMSINLDAVFLGAKHALLAMKRNAPPGGSIINLSSIEGIVGDPNLGAYNASKGGVRLYTKSVALYAAKAGLNIRVNSVHPGYIWTPMVEHYLAEHGDVAEGRAALEALHPIGRIGEPDDIAYGVLYLASDESKFVTGSELVIDGGYTAQ